MWSFANTQLISPVPILNPGGEAAPRTHVLTFITELRLDGPVAARRINF